MNMNAENIISLLKKLHEGDIFVSECKNGSTQNLSHRRLDAWVMKKSWAHPCYIGYEVKISKGDFHSDIKYVDYLPMCNDLYFVCPYGMIQVSEIPLEIGLIYVSKNGTSLLTKKRSVHRKIDEPTELFKYILMWRSKIVSCGYFDKQEYWKKWYEEKSVDLNTGMLIGKRIRTVINDKILSVNEENKKLKNENELMKREVANYNKSMEILNGFGVTSAMLRDRYFDDHRIKKILCKHEIKIDDFIDLVKVSINTLNMVIKKIET